MYSNRLKELNGIANNSFTQVNNSGALIASTAATVTSAGVVNFPLTPFLSAYLSTTSAGVTGTGTSADVKCDTILTQQGGSNYNVSTGVYTIPVTGWYYIGGAVGIGSLTAAMTQGLVQFTLTGISYQGPIWNWGAMRDSSNNLVASYGQCFRLSATNTAKITVIIRNGASDAATILGSGVTPSTYLSIGLIG